MTPQVEIKKEEFSPEQMTQINQAQDNLNNIVRKQVAASNNQQAQSALNKVESISLYKGNKLEANLILKEGQILNDEEKKVIGTFLIESIKNSNDETKKIAFIAFKDEGCTSESLTKYLNDSKFESFIDYKLEKASVSFSDDLQKSETSTEGSNASILKASIKWTDAEFEKFKKEKEFEKGYIKKAAEKEVQKELRETSGITTDVKDEGVLIRMGLMDIPGKKYDPKQTKAYLEMYFTDSELKEFAVIIYSRNMVGTQKFYEELADGKIKGMKPEDFGVKRKEDGTITITYKYKGKDKTQELVGKNGINIQGHADFCHLNQNNDKTNPKGIKAREKMHEYRVAEITKDEIGKNAWNDLSKRVKEACSGCSMIGVADGLIKKEKDIYSDLVAKKVQKLKEAEGLA